MRNKKNLKPFHFEECDKYCIGNLYHIRIIHRIELTVYVSDFLYAVNDGLVKSSLLAIY